MIAREYVTIAGSRVCINDLPPDVAEAVRAELDKPRHWERPTLPDKLVLATQTPGPGPGPVLPEPTGLKPLESPKPGDNGTPAMARKAPPAPPTAPETPAPAPSRPGASLTLPGPVAPRRTPAPEEFLEIGQPALGTRPVRAIRIHVRRDRPRPGELRYADPVGRWHHGCADCGQAAPLRRRIGHAWGCAHWNEF